MKLNDNAKIGIINRGEAALRFIRAVKEYNAQNNTTLTTVAFYIDKEEYAPFVKQADESLALSSLSLYPGKQKSPYLDHELILQGLTKSKCDAIWVGWGFVSEDAPFTEKIEKAGIIFMGPSSKAMATLGDKIQAKDLADSANVPILPWSKKSVDTLEEAKVVSEQIGYPVIVKASNAGGGRGIRFVRTPKELATQYKSAQDETLRITGNSIVFIEYLVQKGRHLEVQVLADSHGNVNTFGVRDCSIQRKNQKIIEETPPANMDPNLIRDMEEAAARLIKAAGYVGAGTVEYLFDLKSNRFFFMEVNTRLQVEHPITETLYGIDLVKGQIDVARGLVVDWSDRTPRGHVMEVRLNAEDPERDFNPAPGLVNLFKAPAGPGIRVDSGIEEGSDIPSDFDSMVAKVIAQGNSREEAVSRLKRALNEMKIRIKDGTTNRSFLLELLNKPEILSGSVHTGYVEELLESRILVQDSSIVKKALIAGAVEFYLDQKERDFLNFSEQLAKSGRPRNLPKAEGSEVILSAQGNSYTFFVKELAQNYFELKLDKDIIHCKYISNDSERTLYLKGGRVNILMVPRGDVLQCEVDGTPVILESDNGGYVSSPSPAIVLSINLEVGQKIKKGDILLVLEAMKMEMIIEAPADGIITEICIDDGAQVAAGQPLVQLESEKDSIGEGLNSIKPVTFNGFESIESSDLMIKRSLHGLFLGFDQDVLESEKISTLVAGNNEDLVDTILDLVEFYNSIEGLFIPTEVVDSSLARPMTYPELLMHYFRRFDDREKGLPQRFLDDLDKAFKLYPSINKDIKIQQERALFNIFRSHGLLNKKQEILKVLLSTLAKLGITKEQTSRVKSELNRLIYISRSSNISLTDAAFHARYHLLDKSRRDLYETIKLENLHELLDDIDADNINNEDISKVSNSGSMMLRELVNRAYESDSKRDVILPLIAHKLNRDRDISSTYNIDVLGNRCAVVNSNNSSVSSGVILLEKGAYDLLDITSLKGLSEVIFLTKDADDSLFSKIEEVKGLSGLTVSIGNLKDNIWNFRSYNFNSKWEENTLHRDFSPLQYRELRIYRLRNFSVKMLYRQENIFLLEATAKDNPKDVRLLGYVDIAGTEMEIDDEGNLQRMVFLEGRLIDLINSMRSAQMGYKYRLVWNRIIIHNRTLLEVGYKDLQGYSKKLLPLTHDLGLEKLVIYSVRKRWSEEAIREIELNYTIVSDDKFNLRQRTPSEELLQSYNNYVSRAVVARQRNSVYPYEFIKLLTSSKSMDSAIKSGQFQEFDITIDNNGEQETISCNGREPGENQANVVFGIISNRVTFMEESLKRVIIISDPSKDLGSLSEPECRRINAAIDLADEKKLPIEWVAISSGAKITMDSGTENLDWTGTTLRKIVNFTQNGGEINIIVPGINVGAQSYWNAEATMLMHTRGLLIMTDDGALLLTGKKALDFSGSVSGENNLDIGGAEKIMGPNGQAQVRVSNLVEAYNYLFSHYRYTYVPSGNKYPSRKVTNDPVDRDVAKEPYRDFLDQGFETIGDIFSFEKNPERKKPFDIRQVMGSLVDKDADYCERWRNLKDSDTSIVWETQMGGYSVGMIGIESRNLSRIGEVPFDGPDSWSGGTLFPMSSKKIARGINAFSGHLPLVIVANLSGFDGSPESLRKLQLEYGAEIGRAVVNFKGPISFVVVARYHGGAYVVFSKSLNPNLRSAALEGSYASVIGGAPAAAVIFPKKVLTATSNDPRILEAKADFESGNLSKKDYNTLFNRVKNEKQSEQSQNFDSVHSVERAKSVGSIDDIIKTHELRPYIINVIEKGM
ncbi:carboxyl transferase domain-containing protein [Thiospirochaeta perfilievii]|nr:carboxyl transferase domain-containing protein [Thiospirochaeta perfilievii]